MPQDKGNGKWSTIIDFPKITEKIIAIAVLYLKTKNDLKILERCNSLNNSTNQNETVAHLCGFNKISKCEFEYEVTHKNEKNNTEADALCTLELYLIETDSKQERNIPDLDDFNMSLMVNNFIELPILCEVVD